MNVLCDEEAQTIIESPPPPTCGFHLNSFIYSEYNFTVCDVGGSLENRALWKYYYKDNSGVIFVVDGEDKSRLDESGGELIKILKNKTLKGKPLLIMLHKTEFSSSMSQEFLIEYFSLEEINDRPWKVFSTSVKDIRTIEHALIWLLHEMSRKRLVKRETFQTL